MRHVFLTLALAAAGAANIAQAQTSVSIVQIWQNFVASRAAAARCGGVDEATDRHFLANLNDVTIRASQAVKHNNPAMPEAEIISRMATARDDIQGKVHAEAEQNGCATPKIQQLLKMYKMHSTMNLYGDRQSAPK